MKRQQQFPAQILLAVKLSVYGDRAHIIHWRPWKEHSYGVRVNLSAAFIKTDCASAHRKFSAPEPRTAREEERNLRGRLSQAKVTSRKVLSDSVVSSLIPDNAQSERLWPRNRNRWMMRQDRAVDEVNHTTMVFLATYVTSSGAEAIWQTSQQTPAP